MSSESSLVIVNIEPSRTEWDEDRRAGLTLDDRVMREWLRRNAPDSVVSSPRPPPMFEPLRRPRVMSGVLGLDMQEPVMFPSTFMSTKKTPLYPRRAYLGAQSLCLSSPYPTFRSGRSTITSSRNITSICRSSISSMLHSTHKWELPTSRMLFFSRNKGKGKEKEKAWIIDGEVLEDWEVVESNPRCLSRLTDQSWILVASSSTRPSSNRTISYPAYESPFSPISPRTPARSYPSLTRQIRFASYSQTRATPTSSFSDI